VKFYPFVANVYPRVSTNFGRFILTFVKMAYKLFHKYLSFCHFRFWVSPSQTAVISLPVMSGSQFIWP